MDNEPGIENATFNLLSFLVEYLTGNAPAVRVDHSGGQVNWIIPSLGSIKFQIPGEGRDPLAVLCPSVSRNSHKLAEPLATELGQRQSHRPMATESSPMKCPQPEGTAGTGYSLSLHISGEIRAISRTSALQSTSSQEPRAPDQTSSSPPDTRPDRSQP
jgi:hypothetical protein